MLTILLGLACFYFTSVLLFSVEHTGPYPSRNKEVALGEYDETKKERVLIRRPVDFFDRFRRLFGLYSIVRDADKEDRRETWIIHNSRLAVWQCPHCLGFWVAFALALLAIVWYRSPEDFFIHWWAAAGINSLIVRILTRES